MIVEDFALDSRQRGACSLELSQNIDAVAAALDHAGNAADLALNPAQARQLALVVGMMAIVTGQIALRSM